MLKKPKHRKFTFVPRYYDPAKEELEERLAKYKEGADKTEIAKAGIRTGFNRRTPVRQSDLRKGSMAATIRLLIIIATLVLVAYFLLQSDGIANFLKSMES